MNAGYPVNTTDDDLFFHPLNDGYEAYYSMISEGGYGLADIYRIEIFSENHPRKFIVRGTAKVEGPVVTPDNKVTIRSTNSRYPERSVTAYTDPVTGEYEFEAGHGDYEVAFEAPDAERVTKDLNLSITAPSDTVDVPEVVLPNTKLVAETKAEEVKPVEKTVVAEVPVVKEKTRKIRRAESIKHPALETPKPVEKPVGQITDTTKKEPVIEPTEARYDTGSTRKMLQAVVPLACARLRNYFLPDYTEKKTEEGQRKIILPAISLCVCI